MEGNVGGGVVVVGADCAWALGCLVVIGAVARAGECAGLASGEGKFATVGEGRWWGLELAVLNRFLG